jgi:hypothetical protein
MALITSAASGNFSAGATWTGGVVPGVGDEARASNGHTVTIDVDTTCDEVSNAGTGIFTLASGVTLTANVANKSTTTSRNCLQFTAASPAIGYIVGNCTGGTVTGAVAAVNTSTGTLNITGSCNSSSGTGSYGAINNSTGTLNITGNCMGGSGSSGAIGAINNSTGTLNITGNCMGGSAGSNPVGAWNNSTGTLNITGNCTAGATGTAFGANNFSTGTMLVVGTIEASEFIGGVGGANRSQVTLLTGPFLTSPTFGVNPIGCNAWRWASTLNTSTYIEVPTSDLLAKRNLVTADNVTGMPAEADVKDGIVYGPASELTGTFAQTVSPAIEDITRGVWDYALSAITTSDTIGTLLKTNIDATISSRSTATTAGTAAAVWDRVLTGATHNVPASAGRRLRILDDERIIADGQVVSATTNTITLQPIGSLCVGQTIVVTSDDTGEKQTRFILAYDSATNTASVDTQWCNIPQAGDEYLLTTVRDPLVTRNDHPAGTVGAEIDEMYLIHGLKDGEVLTVTPTSRTAGAIAQTIGGDGTNTTTVSRD